MHGEAAQIEIPGNFLLEEGFQHEIDCMETIESFLYYPHDLLRERFANNRIIQKPVEDQRNEKFAPEDARLESDFLS